MTSLTFNAALLTLDMTKPQFAKLVQVHIRTVQAWASGQSAVPGAVELLLRTWVALSDVGLWIDVNKKVFKGIRT